MGNLFKGIFINLFLFSLVFAEILSQVTITSLRYQRYEGSNIVWKLVAEEFLQKGDAYFEAKGVYIENLPKGLKIRAKEAEYIKKEEKFLLKGTVSVYVEKEGEIFTEELMYYPKRDFLFAPGRVLIKKGGMEISGEGLSYHLSEGKFQLQKKATAQFKL
ncbi:MAG: LPS export ABC transporter periplasmic protein LptC [Caldimicrobium sp.]